LAEETDDVVVFKILRGLGRMRADDPELPIDRELFESLARKMSERAVSVTYWRHFVETAMRRFPRVRTHAAELLVAALTDHEDRALERAFRLMHILDPTEELEIVYDALKSPDHEVHARGRELLEHVAPEPLRKSLLALVDDGPVASAAAIVSSRSGRLLRAPGPRRAAGHGDRRGQARLAARLASVRGVSVDDAGGQSPVLAAIAAITWRSSATGPAKQRRSRRSRKRASSGKRSRSRPSVAEGRRSVRAEIIAFRPYSACSLPFGVRRPVSGRARGDGRARPPTTLPGGQTILRSGVPVRALTSSCRDAWAQEKRRAPQPRSSRGGQDSAR
jgi:hypothetical protein